MEEIEQLLSQYGEAWRKRYPCFDGLSERPPLEICVQSALSSPYRARYAHLGLLSWVEGWLKTEARIHLASYIKEKSPRPQESPKEPATDELAKVQEEYQLFESWKKLQ